MGLLQSAVLTYQNNKDKVGKYFEGKEPLAPIGHIVTKANIIVTIDQNGEFIRSEKALDEKIIIPVSEESLNRTSTKVAPHPLCDQIQYLTSFGTNNKKQKKYLLNLKEWCDSSFSDLKIEAVYKYVAQDQLNIDLAKDGNLEIDKTGKLVKESEQKLFIAWQVMGTGEETEVWRDLTLMKKYTDFYLEKIKNDSDREKAVCAISGKRSMITQYHMKGIVSSSSAKIAKLISSNDSQNFSYRGRFYKPEEALTISYEASQEAHNALKWLISNQGVIIGKRVYLCWSPQNDEIPEPGHSLLDQFFTGERPKVQTQRDYHNYLWKALHGYCSKLYNEDLSESLVVSFEAASKGRLSVTSYTEMATKDFLSRLKNWDAYCNWLSDWSKNGYIFTPSLDSIAQYSYGRYQERDNKGWFGFDQEDQIEGQIIERLVQCRLSNSLFPKDILIKLIENASKLYIYDKTIQKKLLNVTCAVIRKYHHDYFGEDFDMELEVEKKDRSYQFGRLLAVYEKIERDVLQEQEIGDERETNAIRCQSVFCNRPMHYAFELEKQMERAYFPKLKEKKKFFYKNLIGQILAVINNNFSEKEWDRPLKDSYLMGYYLQRRDFYKKKIVD